jgi:hypothetical protein
MIGAEKLPRGFLDKDKTVLVERFDIFVNLVTGDGIEQTFITVRIEVVGPDKNTLLACRHSEWTNTSHNIANGFAFAEGVDESLMFSVQSAVPVDFCVVEAKVAVSLADLDVHIIRTSKNFVLESAVLALFSNVVNLVDDSADSWVLIDENLADDGLVRRVLVTKIEMSDMAD